MEELNSYSSNAKIGCPFFKKQTTIGICCGAVFENQNTTWLNFSSKLSKENHLKNFCFDFCYQGCPIAAAINENESIKEMEKSQ